MENLGNEKKRIHLLDEIRGLAVFCMVLYHGYFILSELFGISAAGKLYDFFLPVEPFFAGIFITVCGISCSLSHSNLKRGFKILAAAVCFTFVTCVVLPHFGIDKLKIWFGILSFLSFSVILYGLLEKKIRKINPFAGMTACLILYPFFSGIDVSRQELSYGRLFVLRLPESMYAHNWLMPLGIHNAEFYSADYFPVFPNIFVFLFGAFLGCILISRGFPEQAYRKRFPFFSWLGRHAFPIYILHMPVTALLAYAVKTISNYF